MAETALFRWHREVPAEWRADLARLAPPLDRASHLVLFWESGTPVEPVQRWAIYEAVPIAYVPAWKRDAFLADPLCRCPREVYADTVSRCPHCQGIQSAGRARIRRYLEQTECLALPFWVVQGHQGGHPYRYTQVEQNWATLMGDSPEPPVPGSLPYAPFDQRVVRRLRARDRAQRAEATLREASAREQEEAYTAFRSALADYWDNAVAAAFDDVPLRRRGGLVDELPRNPTRTPVPLDVEAGRDAFIHGQEF